MKIYMRLAMLSIALVVNMVSIDILNNHDIFNNSVSAKIQVYPFSDEVKEQRFNHLIKVLRCPKCQNNNLADSNAGLAVDLKDIIYEKIKLGESDDQIIAYLKERYGDFISYRPPVRPSTWFLWYGPFFILLLGGLYIYRFIRTRKVSEEKGGSNDATENTDTSDSMNVLNQWKSEGESK